MTVYKINDLIQCDFYRIPKAFYSNPKYIEMSSAAKLAYARLYDRLSLSQKNGWINANGEVYLNFKRKKLAEALGVGNKKATDIFKELVEKGLIMDVRVGQGKPNRIYIVKPEVSEHQARNFVDEEKGVYNEEDGSMNINPNSKTVLTECYLEPELMKAVSEDKFQFVRNGYFCVDNKDSEPGKPIFNRIVSLKSSFKL